MKKIKERLNLIQSEMCAIEKKEQMLVKGGTEPPQELTCECSVPEEGDTIVIEDTAICNVLIGGEEYPPMFED